MPVEQFRIQRFLAKDQANGRQFGTVIGNEGNALVLALGFSNKGQKGSLSNRLTAYKSYPQNSRMKQNYLRSKIW